jgi:glycosyltransferase involved in cell wall biosynthesis
MIKVGFVLNLDNSWQGGVNYYKNLFSAIYNLPNRKLDLFIFLSSKSLRIIKNDLPNNIKIVVSTAFDKHSFLWWFRKFFQKILHRDPILYLLIYKYKIDVLSHFNEAVFFKHIPIISWIADFQHINFPNFFSQEEIKNRNKSFHFLKKSSKVIILSSRAAKKDFVKFSPKYFYKTRVLSFCINPNLKLKKIPLLKEIKKRYTINKNYFFVPNQFWAHKNHEVVIEALSIALKKNKDLQIVCTGHRHDYRQPKYFKNITKKIKHLDLENNFKILGLVPRQDLLSLMKHSIAIINPSYFEGWSTTVEESKVFGKKILLSKIKVHLEQNPKNAFYFPSNDSGKLAQYLLDCANNNSKNAMMNQLSLADLRKFFNKYGVTYQKIVLELFLKKKHSSFY